MEPDQSAPSKGSLRYRTRWWVAQHLMRSPRLCGITVGSWAHFGGELRERRWSSDWCRQKDLVNGCCACGLINAKEGRP